MKCFQRYGLCWGNKQIVIKDLGQATMRNHYHSPLRLTGPMEAITRDGWEKWGGERNCQTRFISEEGGRESSNKINVLTLSSNSSHWMNVTESWRSKASVEGSQQNSASWDRNHSRKGMIYSGQLEINQDIHQSQKDKISLYF